MPKHSPLTLQMQQQMLTGALATLRYLMLSHPDKKTPFLTAITLLETTKLETASAPMRKSATPLATVLNTTDEPFPPYDPPLDDDETEETTAVATPPTPTDDIAAALEAAMAARTKGRA